ncbi:helix-turn-helix transcriptional regulator [Nocardiopsis quinghaiensis]|uniref:helix-turn-helix transcriptional regulator n=1 Tax=Nocardiopsis quinghaiensis TaxID=464995 RepID=UPI00123ACFDC|nr:helix-turn-helix transcriptional regulator [Nocardiopsis quinghaiensis]
MTPASELGAFLKSRRGALRPENVGLVPHGDRRRVPGLRREELCLLAGVSVTHYTRLEQGRSARASREVLIAIARALLLDDDETAHLMDLASPAPPGRPNPTRPEHASPSARQLINAMTHIPALVLDRRNDVLAWNELGHGLLAGHIGLGDVDNPALRPNLTRLLFLDEHMRELYEDWAEEATLAVASLRLTAGRHPDDRRLAELIGQLTMQSQAFAERWARHPVRTCTSGTKRMHHPVAGGLELAFETLQIPGSPGQRIIAYSAEPESPSENALRILAGAVAEAPTATDVRGESAPGAGEQVGARP